MAHTVSKTRSPKRSLFLELAILFLFGSFFLYQMPPSLADFRLVTFMKAENGGNLVIPADCDKGRGTQGADFEIGHGFAGRGVRVDLKCWYTTAAFKRLFPELVRGNDAITTREQFERMGFKMQPMTLWSAFSHYFVLLFIMAIGVTTLLRRHRKETKQS
jgi:hypothetical protein